MPLKELAISVNKTANFLKHADRDPTAVLEDFDQGDVDNVLFVACHDFGRVAKGQPVELQVFEAWWLAQQFERVSDAPMRSQRIIRRLRQLFPGIRSADRATREALGMRQLEEARKNPALVMEIEREVVLPLRAP